MKFKHFHWLSHHGIYQYFSNFTKLFKYGKITSNIWGGGGGFLFLLYFSFLCFQSVKNSIIPLGLVGCEITQS